MKSATQTTAIETRADVSAENQLSGTEQNHHANPQTRGNDRFEYSLLSGLRVFGCVSDDVSRLVGDVKVLHQAVSKEEQSLYEIVASIVGVLKTATRLTLDLRQLKNESFKRAAPKLALSLDKLNRQQNLIARGLASSDPHARADAYQLQGLVEAQQMALLADAVYRPGNVPPGWINISNNTAALEEFGLTSKDFSHHDFQCQIYRPDPAVFPAGSQRISIAFRGSVNLDDWKNNVFQGVGMRSPHYERAVSIGKKIAASGKAGEIRFTGHSLGGGLATAAAKASGCRDALTFNASGLHDQTVSMYGGTEHPETVIRAYRVSDEVLTLMQEGGGGAFSDVTSRIMPSAPADEVIVLYGKGKNPIARHGMGDVNAGMDGLVKNKQAAVEESVASGAGIGRTTQAFRSASEVPGEQADLDSDLALPRAC